jgi:hypothetical protein
MDMNRLFQLKYTYPIARAVVVAAVVQGSSTAADNL